MDELIRLVTYLGVVSIATERAVDVLKRALVQRYAVETLNGALFQVLAAVFGMVIVAIDRPHFDFITTQPWLLTVLLGLGVSGGSGAWNTALNVLKELTKPTTPPKDTP